MPDHPEVVSEYSETTLSRFRIFWNYLSNSRTCQLGIHGTAEYTFKLVVSEYSERGSNKPILFRALVVMKKEVIVVVQISCRKIHMQHRNFSKKLQVIES